MRPPGGSWGAPVTLSTELNFGVGGLVLAMDGSGNAIAVFGSSYSWRLAGGSWGTAASLPAGSSGGLVAADPAGTFVFADSGGDAFTFAAGATSFGTGSGSRGSLGDPEDRPRPGRDARRQRRIHRDRELTASCGPPHPIS